MDKKELEKMLETPYKQYVDVTEVRYADGRLVPLSFVWDDGREYIINKVKDVRPAASIRAGGAGLRYTIEVVDDSTGISKETFMYLEETRWFMERKSTRKSSNTYHQP